MRLVQDVRAIVAMAVCALVAGGCGQKGDPLPPLVRLPAAPLTSSPSAGPRASSCDSRFPTATAMGPVQPTSSASKCMRSTGSPDAADVDIARHGTRIGSLAVKAPRDPDDTIGPGDADADSSRSSARASTRERQRESRTMSRLCCRRRRTEPPNGRTSWLASAREDAAACCRNPCACR